MWSETVVQTYFQGLDTDSDSVVNFEEFEKSLPTSLEDKITEDDKESDKEKKEEDDADSKNLEFWRRLLVCSQKFRVF